MAVVVSHVAWLQASSPTVMDSPLPATKSKFLPWRVMDAPPVQGSACAVAAVITGPGKKIILTILSIKTANRSLG